MGIKDTVTKKLHEIADMKAEAQKEYDTVMTWAFLRAVTS